jgi:hypothetical protein
VKAQSGLLGHAFVVMAAEPGEVRLYAEGGGGWSVTVAVLGSGSQVVARGATGSVAVGGARPERAEWCVRRCHWRRSAPTRMGEGGRVFEGGLCRAQKEARLWQGEEDSMRERESR